MEVKPITDKDFLQFADLMSEMYASIDSNINQFQSVNTLIEFVRTHVDFIALGLYEGDVLLGFTCGHGIGQTKMFLFTGIYIVSKSRAETKKLIDASFDFIKDEGYLGWEADATNSNIGSILEKYGAKQKYIRYRKEFSNG